MTTLNAGSQVNALAFNPTHYWLAAATDLGVKVWDLDSNSLIADLRGQIID